MLATIKRLKCSVMAYLLFAKNCILDFAFNHLIVSLSPFRLHIRQSPPLLVIVAFSVPKRPVICAHTLAQYRSVAYLLVSASRCAVCSLPACPGRQHCHCTDTERLHCHPGSTRDPDTWRK